MKPILFSAAILLLGIALAISLPKTADLIQSKVLAQNLPNNILSGKDVLGSEKVIMLPQSQGITPPVVTATAILVESLDDNFLMFEKNSNKRVPIASTTKIMTALIGVEYFKPNEILTVPDISMADGSTMGLKQGEKLSFRSLLYGMLLNSGNDAAFTIAANYPGGTAAFINEMNNQAKNLGLLDTNFDNPAGFDSPNHYSSASDLSKIATLAIENPQLARVVGTKETTVFSVDKTISHPLKNLNKLLNIPGVLGIKTGYTPLARENFVGLVERDGHRMLTVVLGSGDRFGETEKLMDWAYSNFKWQ